MNRYEKMCIDMILNEDSDGVFTTSSWSNGFLYGMFFCERISYEEYLAYKKFAKDFQNKRRLGYSIVFLTNDEEQALTVKRAYLEDDADISCSSYYKKIYAIYLK